MDDSPLFTPEELGQKPRPFVPSENALRLLDNPKAIDQVVAPKKKRRPMRCTNCLQIGHRADVCRNAREPGVRRSRKNERQPTTAPDFVPSTADASDPRQVLEARIDALGEEIAQYQRVKEVAEARIRENHEEIERLWNKLRPR